MKKIIGTMMAFAILCGSVPCNAESTEDYGLYPEHKKLTSVLWPGMSAKRNAEFKFTVDGREFVLLDKDDEGNYLVIANEDYGKKPYILEGAGTLNSTRLGKSEWEYDPENTNSIAYWLDNDFRTTGNGGIALPQSVLDNIIDDKEWQVENSYIEDKTAGGTTVPSGDNATTASKAYTDFKANESYYVSKDIRTINAGIVLMSATESMAYHDKLYTEDTGNLRWSTSFSLRTTFMNYSYTAKTDEKADSFATYYYFYRVGSSGSSNIQLCGDGWIGLTSTDYRIRPMFWLEKDFFETVVVDVSKSGTAVRDELKKIGYTDLYEIYKNETGALDLLGFRASNMPKANNPYMIGPKAVGAIGEIIYKYSGKKAETDTYIEKYVSDSENGDYELDEILDSKDINLAEAEEGTWLKFAVVPKDSSGASGRRYWISPFEVKKLDAVVTKAEFVNAEEIPMTALSGASNLKANVTLSSGDVPCEIILAHYGVNGDLKNMTIVETESGKTEYVASLDSLTVETGDTAAIMVQYVDGAKPVYYKTIK